MDKMDAKMDAYHENRMTMFDAYEKRMMATWNAHQQTTEIDAVRGGASGYLY
jgi:hypothetical protein